MQTLSNRTAFLSRSGPVAQLGARFHGMEEVAGSIPARSTKSLNKLDGGSACSRDVCVMVCVITRRFGACGKGFYRIAFRFHPNVPIPFQHPSADVTRDCHDGRIGGATLRKLSDSTMPEISWVYAGIP